MSLSVASTRRPNSSTMAPNIGSPNSVSADVIPEHDLDYIGNLGWMRHQIWSAVSKTTMGRGKWQLSGEVKQKIQIDEKTSLEAAKVLRNEQHPYNAMLGTAIRDINHLVKEVKTLTEEKDKEKERSRRAEIMVQQLSQSNGQLSEENRVVVMKNTQLRNLVEGSVKIVEGLKAEVKKSKVRAKEDEDMYGPNAGQDDDDLVIVGGEDGEESDCDGYTVLKA